VSVLPVDIQAALAELGLRVTHYRRQAGFTQVQLGDYCGLGRTSIANIEGGRQNLTLSALLGIASALGVPPGALLGGPLVARQQWIERARQEEREMVIHAMRGFLHAYERGT
jgi:transcriptional regulator with XRE-family HTH domain